MHTNQNHKTTYRIITALLLILWVAFIFSNSMDNADASTLKSGAVLALLRRILGSEGAALTEFIVRKTAHFTEFAIEGVLLFLVVKGYTTRPLRFLGWPLLAGLMTALTDETIQLFSLGRSSQVTDVWIDFAGVVTGTLLAFLVQAILESQEKETFETTLRRVLREELQAVPSQPVKQPEEAIPQEMMGFLGSLLGED